MKKTKINKKFIYLISPEKIEDNLFYKDLDKVLKTNKVSFFQLRLKKNEESEIILIGKKIQKICKKYNVKFIINDSPIIAKKINADGCHLGQKDMIFMKARKILKNKIIGITCHNSKDLIKGAMKKKQTILLLELFFHQKQKKLNIGQI